MAPLTSSEPSCSVGFSYLAMKFVRNKNGFGSVEIILSLAVSCAFIIGAWYVKNVFDRSSEIVVRIGMQKMREADAIEKIMKAKSQDSTLDSGGSGANQPSPRQADPAN